MCSSYYHKGNSLTGGGVLVSQRTRLVLGVATVHKRCPVCVAAESDGRDPTPHDCAKNFEGSAKAMEHTIGLGLLGEVEEKGLMPAQVIMDKDTTTASHMEAKYPGIDMSQTDVNHTMKTVGSDITGLAAELKKKRKEKADSKQGKLPILLAASISSAMCVWWRQAAPTTAAPPTRRVRFQCYLAA